MQAGAAKAILLNQPHLEPQLPKALVRLEPIRAPRAFDPVPGPVHHQRPVADHVHGRGVVDVAHGHGHERHAPPDRLGPELADRVRQLPRQRPVFISPGKFCMKFHTHS